MVLQLFLLQQETETYSIFLLSRYKVTSGGNHGNLPCPFHSPSAEEMDLGVCSPTFEDIDLIDPDSEGTKKAINT